MIPELSRHTINFQAALQSILANKTRALLTALGIIFGVAAVIAMLAIGSGARKEILNQLKLIGTNNIVIKATQKKASDQDSKDKKEIIRYSPGLSLADANAIKQILPAVRNVCAELNEDAEFIFNGKRLNGRLSGVTSDFFEVFTLALSSGQVFSALQAESGEAVCVVGDAIASRLFTQGDAIGKYVKCKGVWLKVVGVLQGKEVSATSASDLLVNDYNNEVYVPVQTMLLRFVNRSRITLHNLTERENQSQEKDVKEHARVTKQNQLDRIVVNMQASEDMEAAVPVLQRMLNRRHNNVKDFEIVVPEHLLKQQQRTKDIFNLVLGLIAGISLVVGGIGIMNIMLANVMERIREIGVRLSLGARPNDIVAQFLFEAVLISISGGIIGVLLGISLSLLIPSLFSISTEITWWSIAVSFFVAATTGLLFGIGPARKAAKLDPVTSLRYE